MCIKKKLFLLKYLQDNIEPDDCRILGSTSQILTVTQEKIAEFHEFPAGATINHEVMT